MIDNAIVQIGLFLGVLLLLVRPMGTYIANVMEGKPIRWLQWLAPVERACYRLGGVSPAREMTWSQYAGALLIFNILGAVVLYVLQRCQAFLPLNPAHFPAVSSDSSFNTAVSFVTNTNWQDYAGESTLSYLTQMLGLTVQNFLSAATGIVVAIALIRGFARHSTTTLGNFWVDITRCTIYILLPLALIVAIIFMQQGVVQTFLPAQVIHPLQAQGVLQTIPLGPVASQEAIKLLGTNGGGFFNANSAHPFENPTPLTNFLQMLGIFLIPAGLCYTFGKLVGDIRQGWTLFITMIIVFVGLLCVALYAEQVGNPYLTRMGADQTISTLQAGGNMEGKEIRFGIVGSVLFSAVSTATSCGAVNNMHDSLTPLGGLVPLFFMQLGEVIFGGVGSGLYTILIFAMIAVFIAGLMIGRTPEYVGKKIETFEMKMAALTILVTPTLVLISAAIAVLFPAGQVGIGNPGAHGFTEILYAFTSAGNNNGSAFAGLSVNTPFYNILLGIVMWFGRFWMIVPVLAIAGSLASKKSIPVGPGTLPTQGILFVGLLIGTIVLIGALNYVPALALGPVIEQVELP